MGKRRKKNEIFLLIYFIILIYAALVQLIFRLLLLLYDVITIYTSKYYVKSGKGIFKTLFIKGNYGEFILYRKVVRCFGKDNVYTNVYLPNYNTDYTEIDIIALSNHGIYVFEMKNYSGYIYGHEKDQYWTQVLSKSNKYKLYNPLRQNYAHTKAVEEYLGINENETIPVIVFSNRCNLNKVNVSEGKNIIKINRLNKFLISNKSKDIIFSDNQIKDFSIKIIEQSNMSQRFKNKHIDQISRIKENADIKKLD